MWPWWWPYVCTGSHLIAVFSAPASPSVGVASVSACSWGCHIIVDHGVFEVLLRKYCIPKLCNDSYAWPVRGMLTVTLNIFKFKRGTGLYLEYGSFSSFQKLLYGTFLRYDDFNMLPSICSSVRIHGNVKEHAPRYCQNVEMSFHLHACGRWKSRAHFWFCSGFFDTRARLVWSHTGVSQLL